MFSGQDKLEWKRFKECPNSCKSILATCNLLSKVKLFVMTLAKRYSRNSFVMVTLDKSPKLVVEGIQNNP